jgi:hypothetical protein
MSVKLRRLNPCVVAVLIGVIGVLVAPTRAGAEETPDTAELYKIVKSLQSRVSALEAEKQRADRKTSEAQAEVRSLRQQLEAQGRGPRRVVAEPAPKLDTPVAAVSARNTYAAVSAPSAFTGFYAGASIGGGGLSSKIGGAGSSTTSSTSFTPASGGTGATTFTSTSSGPGTASLSSRRPWGAIGDLYLGYSTRLNNNFVAGIQGEGTLSRVSVAVSGISTSTTNSTTTNVIGPPTNTTTVATSTFLSSSTGSIQVNSDWMASALLRAGYTPDRMQMYYVLAGYTYGRFSMVGFTDFGMNGATVGAGYERVIGPGWTVKAEGRYTKFADANVPLTALSSSSSASPVTGGTATTAFTSASAFTYNVSADIFTARVGITKYFEAGEH